MMESDPGSIIPSLPWMKTSRKCHRREAWELWNTSGHRRVWMVAPGSRISPFLPKGGIAASPGIPYGTCGTPSSCPSTISRDSWGLGCREPQGGKQGQAGRALLGGAHHLPCCVPRRRLKTSFTTMGLSLMSFGRAWITSFYGGRAGRAGRMCPFPRDKPPQGPIGCFPPPTPPVPRRWAFSPALRAWLSPSLVTPLLCHSFPGPVR